MIHCIILEDEKPAQEVLLSYINKTPFLDCIGIYENGLDITQDKLLQADILFLDVQLPELNGISYLKTITNPPKVIITTAYSNYAIEAFEESVVDYLLKPFSFERFFKAVNRVRNNLIHQKKEIDKNLFLYSDKTLYNIHIDNILFLKAEVDYVKVITAEKSILVLDSLRNWNEKLQNFRFIQIHRSFIINIDKITKIYGNQVFIGDQVIPIGKTYKELFIKKIK
ncbi:LytR/AlgR family response regulator transcription factor [Polaribacter ponticola]|uniref:LytTR family DNA-binding domain-containing protein n=1 Tax=Polaribacter ponticola TaxID=2978475 RepID=A0ABT5S6W9_9FLAO|nr:LytTR family DNA-binding domain-containing protein [Polaribacter sp. MSW5]MDD7913097.1 LytTR family DNA-binding domain-containing protein [Polaribacter sp. MSW5]